jgi:hypothetical protein
MDIKAARKKGRHFNMVEKYHIYKINKDNLHMNDTYNPIFVTLH